MNHGYPGLRSTVWAAEYPSGLAPINSYWSQAGWRPQHVSDAMFDELYENALAATTVEEQQEWARQANLRIAEQLWTIRGPIAPLFGATQPWIKGYNGEGDLGAMQRSTVLMYLWVDQDLKRELGLSESAGCQVSRTPLKGGVLALDRRDTTASAPT